MYLAIIKKLAGA